MLSYDAIGQAVHNYHFKRIDNPITIHSDGFDEDFVAPSYFFRTFKQMPKLEQIALQKATGRVLDIGACAGCHSLFLQQKGVDVTAMEQSELCCEVLKDRGILQVIHADLMNFKSEKFDTLLLLMNGTGIAGRLGNLKTFLNQLKDLLNPGGQILIDSSDLIYLYMDDEGAAEIDINAANYYGELVYQAEYNGIKGRPFPWLYIDSENLSEYAKEVGLKIENIEFGDHFDYLATIKLA